MQPNATSSRSHTHLLSQGENFWHSPSLNHPGWATRIFRRLYLHSPRCRSAWPQRRQTGNRATFSSRPVAPHVHRKSWPGLRYTQEVKQSTRCEAGIDSGVQINAFIGVFFFSHRGKGNGAETHFFKEFLSNNPHLMQLFLHQAECRCCVPVSSVCTSSCSLDRVLHKMIANSDKNPSKQNCKH